MGSDLVKALFKNIDPLNKTISVKGNKFTIIGVLESKGSTFSNRQDFKSNHTLAESALYFYQSQN